MDVHGVPTDPRRAPLPATGAWRPGDPPADRRFLTIAADRPFTLEGGGVLRHITLAYETWGVLDARGANAVLVCHALTGDAHAAGRSAPGQPTEGWWDGLIGPGRAIDTDRWFVVCANVLGGCQGTTGPATEDPDTGTPYGARFPVVTIRDVVRTQHQLADHLGIASWAAVVGGSMGGMQALEWAVMFPDRVRAVAAIATTAAASAQQIAFSAVGRRAVVLDPGFRGGDYYDAPPGEGPHRGLAVARSLAQVTYRAERELQDRFGRAELDPLDDRFEPWQRFQIESYLDYHGAKLARRFDANSYLVINKMMDLHDLGRGRGGVDRALARVRARALTMSITTDELYWPWQQDALRDGLRAAGVRCDHVVIDSPHGHDAFLLEDEQVGAPLAALLEEIADHG